MALKARAAGLPSPSMKVIDTIGDDGPKLVEMPPEGELSLRLANPDLKIVPEVFYHREWFRPVVEHRQARKAAKRKVGGRCERQGEDRRQGGGAGRTRQRRRDRDRH